MTNHAAHAASKFAPTPLPQGDQAAYSPSTLLERLFDYVEESCEDSDGRIAPASETDASGLTSHVEVAPGRASDPHGAPMHFTNMLYPHRVDIDNPRESLAIQAHNAIATALPGLHVSPIASHPEIIRLAVLDAINEPVPNHDLASTRRIVADMVQTYVDLYMPSVEAEFCPSPGCDDGIAWRHPNVGVFFDIVVAGRLGASQQILDPLLNEDCRHFIEQGNHHYGSDFAGLRIVALDRPETSIKVAPRGGGVYRLAVTDLDPWHIENGRVSA